MLLKDIAQTMAMCSIQHKLAYLMVVVIAHAAGVCGLCKSSSTRVHIANMVVQILGDQDLVF